MTKDELYELYLPFVTALDDSRLNQQEVRIAKVVAQLSFACGREAAPAPQSVLSALTWMHKTDVSRTVRELCDKCILRQTGEGTFEPLPDTRFWKVAWRWSGMGGDQARDRARALLARLMNQEQGILPLGDEPNLEQLLAEVARESAAVKARGSRVTNADGTTVAPEPPNEPELAPGRGVAVSTPAGAGSNVANNAQGATLASLLLYDKPQAVAVSVLNSEPQTEAEERAWWLKALAAANWEPRRIAPFVESTTWERLREMRQTSAAMAAKAKAHSRPAVAPGVGESPTPRVGESPTGELASRQLQPRDRARNTTTTIGSESVNESKALHWQCSAVAGEEKTGMAAIDRIVAALGSPGVFEAMGLPPSQEAIGELSRGYWLKVLKTDAPIGERVIGYALKEFYQQLADWPAPPAEPMRDPSRYLFGIYYRFVTSAKRTAEKKAAHE